MIADRFVFDFCKTYGSVRSDWGAFSNLIAIWPLDGDNPETACDPLSPTLRHMTAKPAEKAQLCMKLFTDDAIRPLIKRGPEEHSNLNAMIEHMLMEIDRATTGDIEETL